MFSTAFPLVPVVASPDLTNDQIERDLRSGLAHVRLGSYEFHRKLAAVEKKDALEFRWQNAYGPTPIRLASLGVNGFVAFSTVAFWQSGDDVSAQILGHGKSMSEADDDESHVVGEAFRSGNRLVHCGYGTANGNWIWPSARVYNLKEGRWKPAADTGMADESGFHVAHFARRHGKIDPNTILVWLRIYPDHLMEPHAGPHLEYSQTWTIRGNQVRKSRPKLIPTAFAELDRLASLAQSGRRARFNSAVPQASRRRLWALLQHTITVFCEGDITSDDAATFSLWNDQIHETGKVNLQLYFALEQGKWRFRRLSK